MATGFWQGASQGYDKGSTLGAQMYRDLMAQKAAQEAKAAEMEMAGSDRLTKDYQFERQMDMEAKKLAQQERMSRMKQGGGVDMPMTPGRKAADIAFGKDYVDFSTTGLPQVERGLGTLGEAREELRTKGKDLTGPFRGLMPDAIRAFPIIGNPEAVGLKERIRGAVQNTLKATLGAQFTEKEGERIFSNAYNDRLSPEENIKRLDAVIEELKAGKDNRLKMGEYFENRGTLTGYQAPGDKLTQDAMMIMSDPEATPEEKAWAQSKLGK